MVCADREGYPIALAYLVNNRNTFILNYSVGDQIERPLQVLEEATKAIVYIRENAEKYDVNPERIFVVGFSAGAHLTGWLGTCWNIEELSYLTSNKYGVNRPKGIILCYPVVSSYSEKEKWFESVFRTSPITDDQRKMVSLYYHVNANSSPAFILHTFDDDIVPVRNSLDLAQAYAYARVPFELHIYPHAPHGIALANKTTSICKTDYENPQIARWVNDSCVWMDTL